MNERCAINFCPRKSGVGTLMRVRAPGRLRRDEIMVQICEEHWQAIKAVPYE